MILILSNKWDLTVDLVIRELRKRQRPFIRLNTEDLPLCEATVSLPGGEILVADGRRDLSLSDGVRVIWNRRPGRPFDDVPRHKQPPRPIQRFVSDQWLSWLEATQLLENVEWINHPHANAVMESKIRQLSIAVEAGFLIPPTLVTNDPKAVARFLTAYRGRVVAKALYSPLIELDGGELFIFANRISELDPGADAEIRVSPSIFQKALEPKLDYRVTVIGDEVFAARIEGKGKEVPLDWRTEEEGLSFTRCSLPSEVEERCRGYVRRNNLVFGAIDLVECEEEFYFLEINPNGEWGWLEKTHGIPISRALCDLMTEIDDRQ